ncbi:carboxypeptidase-like regulatory domain-containing protein, partial [Pedobacter sp.]
MKKKLLMLFLGVFLLTFQALAQQKTITGKVLDEDRLPLPGASIRIKGATGGSTSSSDGVYSIKVNVGQTIVFSFIGTHSQEVKVGNDNVIDIVLKSDANQLSEVQVTGALGITDAKKSLSTSSQSVKGTEIAQTQRENFINGLQGRVAGLQVNSTSGVPGASSVIILRGVSSINSNNPAKTKERIKKITKGFKKPFFLK